MTYTVIVLYQMKDVFQNWTEIASYKLDTKSFEDASRACLDWMTPDNGVRIVSLGFFEWNSETQTLRTIYKYDAYK
ncbi:MAG: hypothetical protein J6T10_19005 [Methanobrevibacter sp.]|nr:hypothetical protein [Methanobrevibacter sp.]